MGQFLVSEFYASIERHLEESHKTWIETGSKIAPISCTSAKLAFEGTSTDYFGALQDLYDKVSGRSAKYPYRNYA